MNMYKVRVYDGKMEKVSNALLLLTHKKTHSHNRVCCLKDSDCSSPAHDFMLTLAFVFLYRRSSTVRISH